MSDSPPRAGEAGNEAGPRAAAGSEAESLPEKVVLVRSRLLEDWRSAAGRARSYLRAAGVGEPARTELAERAVLRAATTPDPGSADDALGATLSSMRHLVLEKFPRNETRLGGEDAFLAWRLGAALAGGASEVSPESVVAPQPSRRRLASIKSEALKWWVYWRIFFMSCAELWGYENGNQWMVCHYLFTKNKK
jgi:hypothetical protein